MSPRLEGPRFGGLRFGGLSFAAAERPGLQALKGEHRSCVACRNPKKTRCIAASVDVDAAMETAMPDAPRWDYLIWYEDGEAHLPCVEVHPAASGHSADEVIAKRNWLEGLLAGSGLPERRYYWVPTGEVALPRSGSGYRRLAESQIRVKRTVFLDER